MIYLKNPNYLSGILLLFCTYLWHELPCVVAKMSRIRRVACHRICFASFTIFTPVSRFSTFPRRLAHLFLLFCSTEGNYVINKKFGKCSSYHLLFWLVSTVWPLFSARGVIAGLFLGVINAFRKETLCSGQKQADFLLSLQTIRHCKLR